MRISFVAFAVFFLVSVASFLIFDAILRILHSKHYVEWEEAGKPYGFFFRPEPVNFYSKAGLKSMWGFQRMGLTMTFKTPAWMIGEPKALGLLRSYRILGVVSVLVWLIFGYCVVYQL